MDLQEKGLNKDMPKVTVLTPVYNGGKYIADTIRSILSQTFVDFEYIIVDDGSSDNTVEVVKSFKDPRIRLIVLNENRGNRVAANIGLKEANGVYIVRIDADDIAVPDRIEKQVQYMDEHPGIGLSGGHLELFGTETGIWKYPVDRNILNASFLFSTGVCQGVSILRRSVIVKYNLYYDEIGDSFSEDNEYFMRLRKYTDFGNIDKVLIKYRRHPQNISARYREEKLIRAKAYHEPLEELGIKPTPQNLDLHFNLMSMYLHDITPESVKRIYQWKRHLLERNKIAKVYDQYYFKKVLGEKWDRLFYILAGKSVRLGLATLNVEKSFWQWKKVSYLLKLMFNNIFKR